jgi:hypothetical protein
VRGNGHEAQVQAVVAPDLLDGLQGLGEVVAGVDEDDLDARLHLDREVDEDGVGHRGGQAEVGGEGVDRPLDDLGGGEVLELTVELGQLLVAEPRDVAHRCGVGHQVAHSESPMTAS